MPELTKTAKPVKPTEPSRFPKEYEKYNYFEWLKSVSESIGVKPLETLEDDYKDMRKEICDGFKQSKFWIKLCDSLNDYNGNYEEEFPQYKLLSEAELLSGYELLSECGLLSESELLTSSELKSDNKLLHTPRPKLLCKPWESFLQKTYRKNKEVSENSSRDKNWYLPENWYQRINDIVRTSFVVKYFDGVDFLYQKI